VAGNDAVTVVEALADCDGVPVADCDGEFVVDRGTASGERVRDPVRLLDRLMLGEALPLLLCVSVIDDVGNDEGDEVCVVEIDGVVVSVDEDEGDKVCVVETDGVAVSVCDIDGVGEGEGGIHATIKTLPAEPVAPMTLVCGASDDGDVPSTREVST
jgi:hypothetical protein